ncbi:TPA: hypothetical protein U1B12_000937 [Streptococcus suis]|uniref:hypothetical protein n=1 Tax=Streptococcus suis TaxID=1307 RepID=UPI00209B12B6|nr:hypothetical protein [Streptococcus suis]MCO8200716.1 hypothetical protein [Streptococcus suis]MCO8218231.1 hypothetical protein [Streptococcus suis]HEM3467803.1 hypothetical protein [Streptococcus suis]HEM3478514.1 hypothetical protein [Streptococcus suis]
MDFTDYLYTKIGERVAKHRKTSLTNYSDDIRAAAAEKYNDNNIRTGITPRNLSKIEKGIREETRSFLTDNQIKSLSAKLACTETELLLGKKEDIEEILKILLFRCLLNDSKITDLIGINTWRDLYQKSQTVFMQSNENTEKLGNIILKFLLTNPTFQNHFITTVFYYSDDFPKKFTPFQSETEGHSRSNNYRLQSRYDKNRETINSQLQDWYVYDSGNIISILLRKPGNFVFIFYAFDHVVSKIIDLIFNIFNMRFTNNLNKRGTNNTSPKMIDYLETNILFDILSDDDIYHYLSEELRKEQIKKNGLFHIQFLQLLQYQNLLLEKVHSEYRDTTKTYDEYKLYSDLSKIIEFYNGGYRYNPLILYIYDFIDNQEN